MQIIKSCKCDESNANITNMLKQNLFIVTAYLNAFKINIHIPIDIQLSILYHIGSSIICKWQIYLFYITVNHQQYQHGQMTLHKLRKRISFYGCDPQVTCNSHLTLTRNTEDTTRGKAWRLLLGLDRLDSTNYQTQIKKGASKDYIKIRGDTKRTFLTSAAYNSRVPESRLIRLLNSFVQQYHTRYLQAHDAIAGILLYVMPELPAFESFCSLINAHIPLYFHSDQSLLHRRRAHDLIGSYAASYLAWDILKVCDKQIFDHLNRLPAHAYLFPLVASFQTICKPFTEVIKLWDFLFCFGFHLNPVMAAAHIIVNKKRILLQTPPMLLRGLLSQRMWMNRATDASEIVHCTLKLIETLKESQHKELWNNVLYHATNLDVAASIKMKHATPMSPMPPIKVAQNSSSDTQSITNDEKDVTTELETDAKQMDKSEDNNTEEDMNDNKDNDDDNESDSSSRWSMSSITSMHSTSDKDDDAQGSDSSTSSAGSSAKWGCDRRWAQLNEFELNDEQIELFNTYEAEHNQLLSEQHTNFIQSQNQCIAMDCVDEDLLQYWKSFMSSHCTS
eukprot:18791_1